MVLGIDRKGLKISYITDTRPIEEINTFVAHSDILFCEGTYGNEEDLDKAIKNKHMTFSEAAKIANTGEVKELVLTHFSPAMLDPSRYLENATTIFANTIIGEDRLIKKLNFRD